MAKYIITNKAVSDLSDIWYYTLEEWSERQAEIYYQMLIETFEEVAENPELGKNYEGILKQLFGYNAGKHIIFYRKINVELIEIERILHEQMDLKNRILE